MNQRKKIRLNKEQKNVLWAAFFENMKPNKAAKISLAQKININLQFIQNWFRNARANFKNKLKKDTIITDNFILVPYCNALCIKPTVQEVEMYISLNTEGNIPVLKKKFNNHLGVFNLSYW